MKEAARFRELYAKAMHAVGTTKGSAFLFFLFFLFFANSSVEFNDRIGLDDWKSCLRADAGGYYVYLPGTFHHGMKASTVSDSVVWKGGGGFHLDQLNDRILTKYPIGTAFMQLPFYLVAETVEGFGATDGWSRTHHRAIQVAGIFYWSAGLWLFLMAMRGWRPSARGVPIVVLVCVAFGTNSFYYAFRTPGYSHVYSFFLVALALYAAYRDHGSAMRPRSLLLLQLAIALLVVVRHIDGLAALAIYALLWIERPELFRSWRLYVQQALIGLLVASPQLLYWFHAHGSLLVYSYGEERFTNLADPQFQLVLLSPLNGLLPHAPAFFLLVPSVILLFIQHRRIAWTLTGTFSLLLNSCAAWHAWHFGCGYGMRPFVEYTPFLGLALWWMFDTMQRRYTWAYHGLVPMVVLICFIHYRAMLQYGACYVADQWDWLPYGRNVLEAFFGRLHF